MRTITRSIWLPLVTVCGLAGCPLPPPSPSTIGALDVINLTGVWRGDDGGLYAVRGLAGSSGTANVGTVVWMGLEDAGLERGVGWSNVFSGTASIDPATLVVTVSGPWMDVPRGATWGSGTLSFTVTHDGAQLDAASVTGSLRARRWTRTTLPLTADTVDEVLDRVHKNVKKPFDGREVLGPSDNLHPMRDATVVIGTVQREADFDLDGWGFTWRLGDSYADFCTYDHDDDGDVNLNVKPDLLDASFWDPSGWDPAYVKSQPTLGDARRRFDTNGVFHSELVMFGRDGTCDAASIASGGGRAEMPGWADAGGNAVLVNGRPTAHVAASKTLNGVAPADGQRVRLTGLVSLDCGHGGNCGSGPGGQGLEVHPVYAIDFIEASHSADLTGAWDDGAGNTFYVRVAGSAVAVLGLSPFRNASFAMAGMGSSDANGIALDWADLPVGGGSGSGRATLRASADHGTLTMTAPNGATIRTLTKLYGACPQDPGFCSNGGRRCNFVLGACGTYVDCGSCDPGYVCNAAQRCAPPAAPDCTADPSACSPAPCPKGTTLCACNGTRRCERICPICKPVQR